jgi:hypothetical protein
MPIKIVDVNGAAILDAVRQRMYVVPMPISRTKQATIDAHVNRARNFWLSYMNIQCTCYNVLDSNIDDAFKLTSTYGRPDPVALLQNDTLFRSIYSPLDAPKVLFRQSKDCQEVQILGKDPYTPQQLLNNAVHLFLQCGLYTRKFTD